MTTSNRPKVLRLGKIEFAQKNGTKLLRLLMSLIVNRRTVKSLSRTCKPSTVISPILLEHMHLLNKLVDLMLNWLNTCPKPWFPSVIMVQVMIK